MTLTGVAFSLTQQLLALQRRQPAAAAAHHRDRLVHPRPAAADGRRLRDPGDARRARAGAGRHLADAGASVRAVPGHSRHGDAAGRARRLRRRDHREIRPMENRLDRDADELVRLSDPVHVRLFAGADHARRHRSRSLLALGDALLGIFIGTHGGGRLFHGADPGGLSGSPIWSIAVMVLVPSNAFAGGSYVAIAGVVLALVAIAREMHARPCQQAARNRANLTYQRKNRNGASMRIDAYTHFFPAKYFENLLASRRAGHRQARARGAGDPRSRRAAAR